MLNASEFTEFRLRALPLIMEDLLALPKEELVAKLKKIKEQVTRWVAHRWPSPPHAGHGVLSSVHTGRL